MGPLIVEPSKRRANGGECLERSHEQHGGHHDAEDLQGVAGHVHHDGVHGDGFRGSDGEFPGLFEEEIIGFDGGWGDVRFATGFLSGWLADCGDVRRAREGGAGGGGTTEKKTEKTTEQGQRKRTDFATSTMRETRRVGDRGGRFWARRGQIAQVDDPGGRRRRWDAWRAVGSHR